jgi:hypothetical protein
MNENENENPSQEEAPLVPPAVSQAASQLGRRGRGRPKQITEEDRQRRSDQMKELNEKRRTIRVQGIVVNGPRGNTTIPQVVKTPLIQPVTNPAVIDSINRASQTPPPWQGQKVARVQGRRAE